MSWEMVNLASKRICSVFSDGDWIETKDQSQDGIRLVQTGNVGVGKFKDKKNRARYISSDKFEELNCTEVLPGDLLVSRLPEPIGRSCIVPHTGEKMITSVDCTIIRTNEDVSTDFIKFYQRSERYYFELQKHVTGTTRKRISRSNLGKIKVPLPPLPEQQRIADILDKAEAINQKREQALALCDEFLRATFLDMFGDPVSNPKSWKVDKLKNLTSKIGSGSTPRGGKESYLDTGMTLVRSLNIYDDEFVKKGLAFISKVQADKLSNVALEADDVLLNITGASVCRCAMMDNSLLPARVNQHVCIIRPTGIDNLFLLHLLISKNYKRKLMTLATSGGATREALTKEDITELDIIVPHIELQKKFSEIIKKINGIKARIRDAQELPLFDALSQQAFKGELTQ